MQLIVITCNTIINLYAITIGCIMHPPLFSILGSHPSLQINGSFDRTCSWGGFGSTHCSLVNVRPINDQTSLTVGMFIYPSAGWLVMTQVHMALATERHRMETLLRHDARPVSCNDLDDELSMQGPPSRDSLERIGTPDLPSRFPSYD